MDTKIDVAQVEVDSYDEQYAQLAVKITAKNAKVVEYNEAYEALKAQWKELYNNSVTDSITFDEREYLKNQDDPAYSSIKPLYDVWDEINEEGIALNEEIKIMQETLVELRKIRDEKLNIALSAWRKTEAYKSSLYQYRESVSFSYLEETAKAEDAADLARSFIYVSINVLGDANKTFAEDLMARIQVIVPAYVSENMIIPSGYSGTRCIEITTTSGIALTNPDYMKDSIIKFALLGGAVCLILACVILVIVDSSDKRVRNYEQIERYLKVPLLGIIPSIDEEKINSWQENMKNGKGEQL